MNSIIFISGGSKGIGLATAIKFARDLTNTVIIASRREANLKKAIRTIKDQTENYKVYSYKANFTKIEEIRKVVDDIKLRFKRIDVLVNNVALSLVYGSMLKTNVKAFEKMMKGNIMSYFFASKFFLEIMPKKNSSSIIFLSSSVGKSPDPVIGIYSVTKTAIMGLSLALSKELLNDGIRVNCIAPGLIKTDFSKPLWENGQSIQKMGKPEDVANVIHFICSEGGKFINGAYIPVTGEPLPCI